MTKNANSMWAALLLRAPADRDRLLTSLYQDARTGQMCWQADHAHRVEFYREQNVWLAERVRYLEDLIQSAGIPTDVTPVFPWTKEPKAL